MKWTDHKPTQPGFYWYQREGGPKRVVEVRRQKEPGFGHNRLYVVQTGTLVEEVAEGARWSEAKVEVPEE